MPVDMNQLFQAFFEEAFEMLQQVERVLLNLKLDSVDPEVINFIFRSMHSLKGSSAIFGFNQITEFAHTIESFLDSIRSEACTLEQVDIDYLFKVVDCLRLMLIALQNKSPIDESLSEQISAQFRLRIKKTSFEEGEQGGSLEIKKPIATLSEVEKSKNWKIIFHPNRSILQSISQLSPLFSALADLGKLETIVDVSDLPSIQDIDPTQCYLVWQLNLSGNIEKRDIQEVFFWMVNEEDVTIIPTHAALEVKSKPSLKVSRQEMPFSPQTTSVRVAIDKIDNLINTVGEFVITKSMINQIVKNFTMSRLRDLNEALAYLEHNSRELQDNVMSIRMVPIEFVFNRLPRLIHDLAQSMGKQVELVISGEQTELDKNIIEKLADPIIHLVRNSLDHGIESPNLRIAKGKSPQGLIQLRAYQEGGNVLIDIIDDGAGFNKEKIRKKAIQSGLIDEKTLLTNEKLYELIFKPGFTTAESVSNVSGRGVGLDVVYRNINDLSGEIDIEFSEDIGTIFRLHLPLTLAIMDCQLVRVGEEIYIIPLITITEIMKVDPINLNQLDDKIILYFFRKNYIPIVFLAEIFSIPNFTRNLENKYIIVVEMDNQIIGLVVDEVLLQQQVVIKSLGENYKEINCIAGVTILGDGHVALIIDVKSLIDITFNKDIIRSKYINKEQTEPLDIEKNLLDESTINGNMQFLSFFMAGQGYGIDIAEVKEIRMWEKTTLIPNAPSYIKGIINLRGIIIPIVDLRERFGLKHVENSLQTPIITLSIKKGKKRRIVGVIVDEVADTFSIHTNDIQPIPEKNASEMNVYIRGVVTINNQMIALLNIQSLIVNATEQETLS